VARRLEPVRALAVVRLVLAGVTAREAARRTGVSREAATNIQRQLDRGDLSIVLALRRRTPRIRTNEGRPLSHEELLLALVRRAAVEAVEGIEV